MPRVIYIGRKNDLCGKTVFEILANLKNFGVGRVLQRNTFNNKYPDEPTFYKIVQVAPQMDQGLCFGRCWVQETFRGLMYPSIREIKTHHPDYLLVPKHLEPDFKSFSVLGVDKSRLEVLPSKYNCPPVMAEYFNRRHLNTYPNIYLKGGKDNDSSLLTKFQIEAKYPESIEDEEEFNFRYKIAKDDEKPTIKMEKLIFDKFKSGINYHPQINE